MGNYCCCKKLSLQDEEKKVMSEWIAKDIFITEDKHHNGSIRVKKQTLKKLIKRPNLKPKLEKN